MPIYEFYCDRCHRIYSFLSRGVNTRKRPSCPGCGKPRLERCPSTFAVSRGRSERGEERAGEQSDLPPGFDESRMESAVEAIAREAEGMDENDPRQAGRLMRRLYDAAGLPVGGAMEEAIRRMEAGEDPESIEEELGDRLEEEDPFGEGGGTRPGEKIRRIYRRTRPPSRDDTLYEL